MKLTATYDFPVPTPEQFEAFLNRRGWASRIRRETWSIWGDGETALSVLRDTTMTDYERRCSDLVQDLAAYYEKSQLSIYKAIIEGTDLE